MASLVHVGTLYFYIQNPIPKVLKLAEQFILCLTHVSTLRLVKILEYSFFVKGLMLDHHLDVYKAATFVDCEACGLVLIMEVFTGQDFNVEQTCEILVLFVLNKLIAGPLKP